VKPWVLNLMGMTGALAAHNVHIPKSDGSGIYRLQEINYFGVLSTIATRKLPSHQEFHQDRSVQIDSFLFFCLPIESNVVQCFSYLYINKESSLGPS